MKIGVLNLCSFVGRKHCFIRVRKSSYYLVLAIPSVKLDLTTAAFAAVILEKLQD